ncbi:MAG: MtrB/PioB family decaheme-associated outer membrane protein [Acidobacteriota bacterium]
MNTRIVFQPKSVLCSLLWFLLVCPLMTFGQQNADASANKKLIANDKTATKTTALPQADTPRPFKLIFEFGGQITSVDGSRPSKFEEYRKVREGAYVRKFSLSANPDASPLFFRFTGREPSERDQRYRLDLGRYGTFRTTFDYTGIPHLYARGARSPFSSSEGGVLTIPDNVQTAFQNATNDQLPALVRNYVSSLPLSTLRVQRHTTDFRQTVNVTENWKLRFNWWNQKKTGTSPLGTGSYERVGTPTGDTFRALSIELPAPVDYLTNQFTFGTSYTRAKWAINADYTFSKFENRIPSLTFDNPFRITDKQATGSGGVFDRMAFARGIFALAPSNEAKTFMISGFIELPHDSRWASALGWSQWEQNEDFLPYTLNSAIVASGLPAGTSVTDVAALPRRSLEGEVDTFSQDHLFTTRVTKSWMFNLHYRMYDYDNVTHHIKFPGYVAFGESFWRTNINTKPIENEPVSFTHQMASAESVWRIADPLDWKFEYKLDVWDRENRQVERSNEHTISTLFSYKPTNRFTGRLSYAYSDRSPLKYNPGILEFNRLRMFDQSKRLRHNASLQWQYHINPQLGLSGTFGYLSDDYDQNFFGLTKYIQAFGSIDLLCNVNDATTFYFNYGRDRYSYSLNQIAKTAVPFDLANRWNRDERDLLDTLGLGVTTYLAKEKLFLDVHYGYSFGRTRLTTVNPNTPSAINVLNAAAYPFPDVKTRLNEFNSDISYQLTPNFAIGTRYIYEPYHLEDYAWDNQQPYQFGQLPATQDGRRFLLLDSRYTGYDAHVWGAYVRFSW